LATARAEDGTGGEERRGTERGERGGREGGQFLGRGRAKRKVIDDERERGEEQLTHPTSP